MQKGSVGVGESDNGGKRKDSEKIKKHAQKETEGSERREVIMVKRSTLQ